MQAQLPRVLDDPVTNDWIAEEYGATDIKKIKLPRAVALISYLTSGLNPNIKLEEVRVKNAGSYAEAITFTVTVDRPAKIVNSIHYKECITVLFAANDSDHPEVLAIRNDFPKELPHTNLRPKGWPPSICLFEQKFEEIKPTWTVESFIFRIQEWLAKTAIGTIHAPDQPLEPFLPIYLNKIILPNSFFKSESSGKVFEISVRKYEGNNTYTYVVYDGEDPSRNQKSEKTKLIGLHLATPPATHGYINYLPSNFLELCQLLKTTGFDLLDELRSKLRDLAKQELLTKNGFLDSLLALVITIPHRRNPGGPVEENRPWAFALVQNLKIIGEELGVWAPSPENGKIEGFLVLPDNNKSGESLKLEVLIPVNHLNRKSAAKMTSSRENDKKLALLGAGALGSNLLLNLARCGTGTWIVIDEDIILPHNLVKHAALTSAIGVPKAEVVSTMANWVYQNEKIAEPIIGNILIKNDQIEKKLIEADFIIDTTASIPVARKISNGFSNAKASRISLFLSPSGNDLVMLAEDRERTTNLNSLEMQYLRAVCHTSGLENHLCDPDGRIRYARTCGDVSSTIPNEVIAIHSAIGARVIKEVFENAAPQIQIWTCDPNSMTVRNYRIPVSNRVSIEKNGWTVLTDEALIDKLKQIRASKLPKETGGTLIGSIDISAKIIYVVDTLPTPSDSIEARSMFIRGKVDNSESLLKVRSLTANQLTYIGEWHSHPQGSSARPSGDDLILLGELSKRMHPCGIPASMIIIGEDEANAYISLPKSAQ